jgi:putative endonuclease
MAEHNILGQEGENQAASFLVKNGHKILCTNYRFGRDEIDIISSDNGVIVFTEVKARSNYGGGFPEVAVSKQKQRRIAKVAQDYIERNNYFGEIRYDIISIVTGYPIYHIKDAFFPIS